MTHQLAIKVYIAGPMTGLPNNNYPAFQRADADLRKQNLILLNPANNVASSWLGFMRCSLRQIADADAMYMLKDWQTSKGAKIEHQLAKDLGLLIFYENELPPTNKPESPDLIKLHTKEISPGVKEGWTAATQDMKEQVKLAEEAVNAARCSHLSADDPATGTAIPKAKERFIVACLDVFGHWIGVGAPSDNYAKIEKDAITLSRTIPGLPVKILPVKNPV